MFTLLVSERKLVEARRAAAGVVCIDIFAGIIGRVEVPALRTDGPSCTGSVVTKAGKLHLQLRQLLLHFTGFRLALLPERVLRFAILLASTVAAVLLREHAWDQDTTEWMSIVKRGLKRGLKRC